MWMDGQTDRHDMMKLIVTFCNFVNVPYKNCILHKVLNTGHVCVPLYTRLGKYEL